MTLPLGPPSGPPTDPADLPEVFQRAWNERDGELLAALFDPEALLVVRPSVVVRGEERRAATVAALEHRTPVTVSLRHAYVTDGIALLINDFAHRGTGPDGEPVDVAGTVTDVARRGDDGRWRYLIDNPSGTDRA
jgi:uncharacterized protein (TIGR02246 family)